MDTLIYTMGEKADDIFASLSFVRTPAAGDTPARDESEEYEGVKSRFEEYFIVRHNTIYERARFNQRTYRTIVNLLTLSLLTYTHCLITVNMAH